MKTKHLIYALVLGVVIMGASLLQVYRWSDMVSESDFKVLVIVDRDTGEYMTSGHTYEFYFVTAIPRGSCGSGYFEMEVTYHWGAGCEHHIVLGDNSSSRVGSELIKMDFDSKRVIVVFDDMPDFNLSWRAAWVLFNQIETGARIQW